LFGNKERTLFYRKKVTDVEKKVKRKRKETGKEEVVM
jgi:hypothetical protein